MKLADRLTFGEEVANSITHGVMSIAMLVMLPIGAVIGYLKGGVIQSVSTSIFLISLFLMFLCSTLYHSMAYDSKHKFVFRILDHICIYFAIAGSYTPVALIVIGGWQGILVVVIQWLAVIFGIFYKSLSSKSIPKVSITIYLLMGWTAIFFLPILIRNSNVLFMGLIVIGGLMYSIGTYFYAKKDMKYHHMIWHIFINLASVSHILAIVFFMN